MTKEQLWAAFDKYDQRLRLVGVVAIENGLPLQHARWMCQQALGYCDTGRLGKAERWLCFVQGVLWVNLLYTIDQMKDDNRDPAQPRLTWREVLRSRPDVDKVIADRDARLAGYRYYEFSGHVWDRETGLGVGPTEKVMEGR